MIRVLLADDQALIRSAVADLVSHEPGFEVVGQVADGSEAVAATRQTQPRCRADGHSDAGDGRHSSDRGDPRAP